MKILNSQPREAECSILNGIVKMVNTALMRDLLSNCVQGIQNHNDLIIKYLWQIVVMIISVRKSKMMNARYEDEYNFKIYRLVSCLTDAILPLSSLLQYTLPLRHTLSTILNHKCYYDCNRSMYFVDKKCHTFRWIYLRN